jgi:uncharacterized FlaG/YvyC family protein
MKAPAISYEVVLAGTRDLVGVKRVNNDASSDPKQRVDKTSKIAVQDDLDAAVEVPINGEGLTLKFFYDSEAGSRVIQVVEQETGDIIRQIPPEEVIDFLRQLRDTRAHFFSFRL